VVFRVSECAFHYPPLVRAKELVRSRAIRTRRCCGSRRLSARPTRRSDPNCTPTAYGASKLDHAADPRVRKERAAARAVNCETPAAYAVLDQPREATIRPLTGQQEETVQERDPVLTPTGSPDSAKPASVPVRRLRRLLSRGARASMNVTDVPPHVHTPIPLRGRLVG